ncbi:MAG: hypothetical protein RIB98_15835 [Acidimicrobiales bacterium]
MPVARGPQISARSAVIVGITGVVIALLLGAMVFWVARSSETVQVQLGDTQFDAGFIGRQSEEIAARGPILYADAGSQGQRDIYVQHIGDDPEVGWLAFSVRRPADPRDCSAAWDPDRRTFTLQSSTDVACDIVTFNELGCGLERFPVGVVGEKIIVYLNETQDEVDERLAALETDDEPRPVGPDLSCPAG